MQQQKLLEYKRLYRNTGLQTMFLLCVVLLSHIGYSQIGIPDRLMKSSQQLRREKNLDILSRVQYHYVFIPNSSSLFHTPSCKLLLNTKTIQGCTYYKVAAKTRRPCKVCHPEQVKYSKPVEVRTVRKDNAVQRPEKRS